MCDFCGEEFRVLTTSKAPFFCSEPHKQLREETNKGDTPILSIDRLYVDIEDNEDWQNLPNTIALSAEERRKEEQARALAQARKRNEQTMKRNRSFNISDACQVYRFNGEIHTGLRLSQEDYKHRRQISVAYKRQIYQILQTYLSE